MQQIIVKSFLTMFLWRGRVQLGDIDGAHVGLEFPSEKDLVTLRRVSDDIPWSAFRWFFHRGAADLIWQ